MPKLNEVLPGKNGLFMHRTRSRLKNGKPTHIWYVLKDANGDRVDRGRERWCTFRTWERIGREAGKDATQCH